MKLRNWRLKGLIQKALSTVPGGEGANDFLQLKVGGLRDFEANIAGKVEDWKLILDYLSRVGRDIKDRSLLEIGTGWYPTLPVCHILGGASRVYTVDIVRHANEKLTLQMVKALAPHLEAIASKSGRPLSAVRNTYEELCRAGSLNQLFMTAGIEYRAPEDAARMDLPARSVDIVYSNSVLEHVRPEFIRPIMREAHRVLKDGGAAVHAVACNDHYAHFDRSISFVNFLQYSDGEWQLWNNKLNYQSRLRAQDYMQMAEESGFRIDYQVRDVRPGTREALETMKIAPEFTKYGPDDLVSTSIDFVAVKQ